MLRLTLARSVLAVLAGSASAGVAFAVLGVAPSQPAKLTVESNSPVFAAHNLVPGDTRRACMSVRNAGAGRGQAALYAGDVVGDLARHLSLSVVQTRGCGHEGGERVLYRGTLRDFPGRLSDALIDPGEWRPGERRGYRFELTLANSPAAAGRSARWDWRVAVATLGVSAETSASRTNGVPCTRVALAGLGVGRARTLTRTVRVNRRVRAVLVLRTQHAGATPRVTATTGLRVRAGKTLLVPRWALVRYRANDGRTVTARVRPFRRQLDARTIRPGANRVTVSVRQRRGGRARITSFRFVATPTVVAGQRVCVVST